ncbi:MAG: TRAP transporter large permease [Spirochaetes bacterium]|nr:TRAP transporter large permease [Spirochaetota bacterium]
MLLVMIIFLLLLVLGMPLAFCVGISSFMYIVLDPSVPLAVGVQKMISATQSFPLLAVPFFVMAGNLMNECGITRRLIRLATVLTGHLIGGLAHVSVVLSALMGGVSGSAVSDVAMESRLLGPSMIKQGYSKGYTAAVIGLSSLITATIPPGLGLILYGLTGEVSIGRLFIAGLIPGILMTFILMGVVYLTAKKKGLQPVNARPPKFREVIHELKDSIWALLFPFILIVGIRFGIFTPSEAGAFAVVYAMVIGFFVYKELTLKKLLIAIENSVKDNAMIMLIIACSGIFGYAIITERVPQIMAASMTGLTSNPVILLGIILLFLLVVGMFMEATVNVLLLTPIFLPIVQSVGVDPVHFGILMMTLVTMGGMTPPVGVAMYTACSLLDCPTESYVKESIPFVTAIILEVIILALFPQIVLWLPNLVYGG